MVMPGGVFQIGQTTFGPALVAAVRNGSVPEGKLDDMATRVVAGMCPTIVFYPFALYLCLAVWE